jgi:Tfp pilus assembly protein PilE
MKLNSKSNLPSRIHARGITLIECLVYIGVLGIVFSMGLAAYHRYVDHTAALRRNSSDITQALAAGELWRADIRAATQPPRFDATEQTLHITHAKTEIAYKFSDNHISRRTRKDASWSIILPRVEQSEMVRDAHSHVTAWRWEVELKSYRAQATVRPLFTFIAATSQP